MCVSVCDWHSLLIQPWLTQHPCVHDCLEVMPGALTHALINHTHADHIRSQEEVTGWDI